VEKGGFYLNETNYKLIKNLFEVVDPNDIKLKSLKQVVIEVLILI